MGLLYSLKSRFFPPELCRVAKSADETRIAACLSRTSVLVIGADLGDPLPFDADQGSTIAIVEAAAERKSFDGDVHKYSIESETFLPIFTDSIAAEMFCGAYVSLLNRLHAFRLFCVPGASVRAWIGENETLIVNPQGPSEVKIDGEMSSAIRALLPSSGDPCEAQLVSVALPVPGVSRTIEFGPEP